MARGKAKREPATNGDAPPAKVIRSSHKFELALPTLPKSCGNVLSCGQGEFGQLGLGEDVMEKSRPAPVDGMKDVVDISAGGMHNLCLTRKGEVYSFGCNDEGALGRATTDDASAEFLPHKINLPAPCLKISAGDSHSACLLNDGRVYAWGSFRDSHGNMGLTLEGNKRLPIEVIPGIKSVDIASGGDHLVILTEIGHVYTVGCAEQGQLGRISTRAASGESRRGKKELLKPGVVTLRGKFVLADAIWASTYCTYYKDRNSSKIFAFGLNNYCQLGIPNPSENVVKPVFVPELTSFTDVRSITGGQHHTMVLKNDNKVYVIGRKEYGRLGLGDVAADAKTLTLVDMLATKKVVDVSCGDCTSFAVTEGGEVYAWGMGSSQQLGTGNEDDAIKPVLLSSKQLQGKRILKVSSGGQHSLFLVEENSSKERTPVPDISKPAAKSKKAPAMEKAEPSSTLDEASSSVKSVDAPKEASEKPKTNGTGPKDKNDDGDLVSSSSTVEETESTDNKPAARGRKRKL